MAQTILAVDDEVDLLEIIEHHLQKACYNVIRAETGEDAVKLAQEAHPDLVLLDLMLPEMDGFDVCKTLKANSDTADIPIVMLSARGEEADIVTGLELGADDYVTKPFSAKVLLARVKSVMRRRAAITSSPADSDDTIERGPLSMDIARHRAYCEGDELELSMTEFDILKFLASRPGWVFTRTRIVKAGKGDDYPVTDRAVDVQVVSIRKKLGSHSDLIETVRGVGYRFREL